MLFFRVLFVEFVPVTVRNITGEWIFTWNKTASMNGLQRIIAVKEARM